MYKYIKGEQDYMVNDEGIVLSLKYNNKRILKQQLDKTGYYKVNLYNDNIQKTWKVHVLVYDAFGCKERYNSDVHHKDGNKTNNNINNLELLTRREHFTKSFLRKNTSSKYTGVSLTKSNKYRVDIKHNNLQIYLGVYDNEIYASNIYQEYLKNIV